MMLLLDTHLLLWVTSQPRRLSPQAWQLIGDSNNEWLFSVVSLWEVAIKRGRGRDDFDVDTRLLRRTLLNNGYRELAITGNTRLRSAICRRCTRTRSTAFW